MSWEPELSSCSVQRIPEGQGLGGGVATSDSFRTEGRLGILQLGRIIACPQMEIWKFREKNGMKIQSEP